MKKENFFAIARLSRDDIEALGFEASQLSDKQMEQIAEEMGDVYVENDFWLSLKYMAHRMGLPKKEEESCCPRCIESYDGNDGKRVDGECKPQSCKECGVCKDCEHMSECSKAK